MQFLYIFPDKAKIPNFRLKNANVIRTQGMYLVIFFRSSLVKV